MELNKYEFYPFNTGDRSVGIGGWQAKVTVEVDWKMDRGEMEWVKGKIQEMIEETEGVHTELDVLQEEMFTQDQANCYFEESKKRKELKEGKERLEQLKEKEKILKAKYDGVI